MKRLQHQANTDELTNIFNRREFIRISEFEMNKSFSNQTPLGIILLDIDHFKSINDQYGHTVGDQVLRSVAACLQSGIRDEDVLGRYGGEEFAILLPGAGPQTSLLIAERLQTALMSNQIELGKEKLIVTASFGVFSMIVNENTAINDLLKNADKALYQAKEGGRNRVAVFN